MCILNSKLYILNKNTILFLKKPSTFKNKNFRPLKTRTSNLQKKKKNL